MSPQSIRSDGVLLRSWQGSVVWAQPHILASTSRRRIQHFHPRAHVPRPRLRPAGPSSNRSLLGCVAWWAPTGVTAFSMPTVGASSRGKKCHFDRGWEGLIIAESSPGLRRGDAAALRYQHLLLLSLMYHQRQILVGWCNIRSQPSGGEMTPDFDDVGLYDLSEGSPNW